MAMSDYRLCDVCGGKCFYDSNLNYEFEESEWNAHRSPFRTAGVDLSEYDKVRLDYLGDWAVICGDCAKTHKCIVVAQEPTND